MNASTSVRTPSNDTRTALTHVELTWLEKRIEHWIRFGRIAEEKVLDRRRRIVSFAPHPREIALVPLPAKAETNMGLIRDGTALVIVEGLADGSLAVLQQQTAE